MNKLLPYSQLLPDLLFAELDEDILGESRQTAALMADVRSPERRGDLPQMPVPTDKNR